MNKLTTKRDFAAQGASLLRINLVFPFILALIIFFTLPSLVKAQKAADKTIPGIDFSYAGFGGGGVLLPELPAVLTVSPTGADDTQLLQAAIDYLAGLPLQANGFRGALQLSAGQFQVSGQLHLQQSGIILRGSNNKATTIVATGNNRRYLIVAGSPAALQSDKPLKVTDQLVPTGSFKLTLESTQGLNPGDRVIVTRPSTKAWISALGQDTLKGTFPELRYHWVPGSRNLIWDRTITAIDPAKKQIILDAPITTALEQRFGAGTVVKIISDEPINHLGIENLVLESAYDKTNPKDEEHAWYGIALDNVADAWVRDVTARHFVSSAVRVGQRARRVTVMDCRSEQPVSEVGGYRRYSFLVEGQQVLVQNCTADAGVNNFAIGFLAAGPNVFWNCTATNALGASGSYESWASGVLYENVRIAGAGLRLTYDSNRAQAGGWTAANSVIWNCKAAEIIAKGPTGAPVVVVNSREPLYAKQLQNRLGKLVTQVAGLYTPMVIGKVREFKRQDIPVATVPVEPGTQPLQLVNGRFVIKSKTLWGGAVNDAWWLGQTSPNNALDAGVSITRYVPGRVGPGLTEDLAALAARVTAQGTPFYQSGPAIWYDRRRDDHSIVERPDGNVWAAFYELPWARSGQGKAWDGLSRYDISKYNPWYFGRTRAFAHLADQQGFVLYHHLYNNHNLLETAAHWADFPWRPANNINETGLPEPPPLEPRTRVHVANQFYDASNPKLRELHQKYIWHVLDQLGNFENIIFGLSFQYSGPFAFQKFFQQTVAAWEQQHNCKVRLVLDTSKDVTDAILADPELAKQVAIIDMRYWHYLPDGSLWAPKGGQNLAFREIHPKEFGDPSTPELVYKQVREYHDKYPDKAIVAWHSGVSPIPALMAGGAQVLMRNPTAGHGQGRSIDKDPLDNFVQQHLASNLMHMQPQDGLLANDAQNWFLGDNQHQSILLYSLSGADITVNKKLKEKNFTGIWFDPRTGQTQAAALPKTIKKKTIIHKPTSDNWLLLLQAKNQES